MVVPSPTSTIPTIQDYSVRPLYYLWRSPLEASRFAVAGKRAHSSARLERIPDKDEVGSSSLPGPTTNAENWPTPQARRAQQIRSLAIRLIG